MSVVTAAGGVSGFGAAVGCGAHARGESSSSAARASVQLRCGCNNLPIMDCLLLADYCFVQAPLAVPVMEGACTGTGSSALAAAGRPRPSAVHAVGGSSAVAPGGRWPC